MTSHGEFLYKYRSAVNRDYTAKIFMEDELYFSRAKDFNDPFDCKFISSYDGGPKEIHEYLVKLSNNFLGDLTVEQRKEFIESSKTRLADSPQEFIQAIENGWSEILEQVGICSLSRVRDSILMWSHYADSHRGFCIEFQDDSNDRFMGMAQEVKYSKEYPLVYPIIDSDMEKLEKSLLTKAEYWSYEQEWRAIDFENGPGPHQFTSKLMVGVIFGCNMIESDKRFIRDICGESGKKLKFYQANVSRKSYALEIDEIS